MNACLYIIVFLSIFNHVRAYIVLQVRRQGDNSSKIDALIKKTVPAETFNKIAQKLKFEARRARRPEDISLYVKSQEAKKFKSEDGTSKGIDKIVKILMNLASVDNIGPLIQAHETYSLRPEVLHFRNGQSSIKYDVSVNTVLKVVNDFLNSQPVKKYTDKLLRQSKNVLRSITGGEEAEVERRGNQSGE